MWEKGACITAIALQVAACMRLIKVYKMIFIIQCFIRDHILNTNEDDNESTMQKWHRKCQGVGQFPEMFPRYHRCSQGNGVQRSWLEYRENLLSLRILDSAVRRILHKNKLECGGNPPFLHLCRGKIAIRLKKFCYSVFCVKTSATQL